MPDLTPDAPDVVAQAPQSKVGADAFARPELVGKVGIAQGLEALGQGAEDLAMPLARAQAASDVAVAPSDPTKAAVTRDVDGTPQAATPLNSFILGRAGEEYNEAVKAGYQAKYSSAISQQLTDLHAAAQANNDPQSFLQSANAYAEQIRQANPGGLGNALAAQAHNEASQRYAGLVEQKATLDLHDDLQSVQTHIAKLNNDLVPMARQGLIGSAEYQSELDQLNRSYDALGANPRFGYTPDKIAAEKDSATSMLNGEFIAGRIDDTFTRKGRAAAFDAIKTGIDENRDLKISDEDRNHLHNLAISRLSYLSQEQASNLAAMAPTIKLQTEKLVSGNTGPDRVSDQELNGTLQQLDSMGAFKEAQQLRAARTVSDRMYAVRNLPPDQREAALLGGGGNGGSESQAMDFFTSKGWSQAQAAGIVGNLAHESGLNAGAINRGDGSDGSDSIGTGQWNGARAIALKQFAAQQGRSPYDFSTQLNFVQHELDTSEGNAAAQLRMAKTPEDAAKAFALGYERPQGFMTGDMTKVAGGNDRVNAAVRLAGGGASSSVVPSTAPAPPPYTEEEAQANPWLRTVYREALQSDSAKQVTFAKQQFTALQNGIKFAGNPGPAIIGPAATVLQIADAHPELAEQAAALRGALAGQPAGFAAAGTPDGGRDLLAHVDDAVRQAPGNLLAIETGKGIQAGIAAGHKLLSDDPWEYGRQAQWFPAVTKLDLVSPNGAQTLGQALQDRSNASTRVAAMTGRQQLALSGDDLRQFQGAMGSLDAGSVSHVLSALNGLPGSQLDGLMGNEVFKGTLNGLMRSGDAGKMQAAASFLDAQDRRNPAAFAATDEGTLKQLRVWQTFSQYLPPDEVTKRMMRADDPGQAKAREELDKEADKQLEGVDAGSIVNKLYASHLAGFTVPFSSPGAEASDRAATAAGSMAADYRTLYKDFYADTQDASGANKWAMERLASKYSVSDINGGRIMAYAPEAHYPKVGKSFDWLRDQLRMDVQQTPFFSDLRHENPDEAVRVARGQDYFLMSDPTTQADIAAGRAPSYTVLAAGNDGRLHAIQGNGGKPFRFFGDPTAAQAKAASDFATGRRADREGMEAAAGALSDVGAY